MQDKDTHTNDPLFRGIGLILERVEEDQDNKVMTSVCVNDEGSKALVTLQSLPKQHDHFRSPLQRLLAAWQVRRRGLQLYDDALANMVISKSKSISRVDSRFSSFRRQETGSLADDVSYPKNVESNFWAEGPDLPPAWDKGLR